MTIYTQTISLSNSWRFTGMLTPSVQVA